MLTSRSMLLAIGLTLGLPVAAIAGPDLTPKFNTATGTVRVTNSGNAEAAASWVTITCSAQGGGSCPDGAPAAVAAYMNPAFPDAAAVSVPPLGKGKKYAHTLSFYDTLVFAPGTYVLTVCADAGSAVAENNENNNCVQSTLSVKNLTAKK